MEPLKMEIDNNQLFSEILKQNAMLWSLCETIIDKDKWGSFLRLYEKRKLTSLLENVEALPHLYENPDELKKTLQDQIEEAPTK